MKKTAVVLLLFISSLFSGSAFAQSFDDGANVISLGFGLPPSKRMTNDFKDFRDFYEYKLSNYGTGVLKFEHGLHKYFGLGLNLEFSASRVTYKYGDIIDPNDYKYKVDIANRVLGAFVRFNGHIPVSKFDFYGGVGLGYLYSMYNYKDTNPNALKDANHKDKVLDFDYQITAGVRFMIKENIGMFFEIGRATTICQLGIAYKF